MSNLSLDVYEWVKTQLKRCKTVELHYGHHAITEQKRTSLNEQANAEGIKATWRNDGVQDVVRDELASHQ